MSISDENRNKIVQISGSIRPRPATQRRLDHALKRFKYHFPSLNWWGNTPIEPTGAGLTAAEAITWIRHMLHHLNDWTGKMDDEIKQLEKDLDDLGEVIQEELADQLPGIINEYNLFNLIVTGNNEKMATVGTIPTSFSQSGRQFGYVFKTEHGLIEASKAKNAWQIHVSERKIDAVLDYTYFLDAAAIPSEVTRVWILNSSGEELADAKFLYYVHNNQIHECRFNHSSLANGKFLSDTTLFANYAPYWIVNAFKYFPHAQNFLHYMTLDYKVYSYNLATGEEELLYQIPPENQEIFDPIHDVIEGVSTIWAVTYRGTANRYVKEMNGLCFEPCFDGVEMYDTWETPKKIEFSDNITGITPANMYQNYAYKKMDAGNKDLISAFILPVEPEKGSYELGVWQVSPKTIHASVMADNLADIFRDSIVRDLTNKKVLADYQGFYTYDISEFFSDCNENFIDAPLLVMNDGADSQMINIQQVFLENSEFNLDGKDRHFWQTIRVLGEAEDGAKANLVFDRYVQQRYSDYGFVHRNVSRWFDSSEQINYSKLCQANGDKMDYLSLAGTKVVYTASEYEKTFNDTPLDEYIYYGLPLKKEHPLLQNLDEKKVLIEVTRGADYTEPYRDLQRSSDSDDRDYYEIIFKLTYQDEFAELQMRRLMRFKKSEDVYGGRGRANYVSPWAYVYYTVSDDSAPDGYVDNPNQGIDKKFEDIINEIYQYIDQKVKELYEYINQKIQELYDYIDQKIEELNTKIENLQKQIDEINTKIENLENRISDIENTINNLNKGNAALGLILQHFKDIGVWNQTGNTIFDGSWNGSKRPAGGNINLFGGSADGSSWIRTNSGKSENDLAGGV